MKHRMAKNMVRTICFLIVFFFVFWKVCRLFELKDSRERYSMFWDEPEEYDVWLLGTSHMRYGVQPMALWKDYGIRSYNLAAPSSFLPQVYWTLRNALDYATPKVVVVDCYHVEGETKTWEDDAIEKVHTGFDSIPFSPTKVRAVFDIFDTAEQRIEYLFGFYSYHNRWESLDKRDFLPEYSVSKGSRLSDEVSGEFARSVVSEMECSKEEALGHFYLRRIIEECQGRGIPIVLTAIPSYTGDDGVQLALNRVEKIAEEYGVDFLNMVYDESLGLEYSTDFHDKGHVNKAGALKVSRYLGEYLRGNFDLMGGIEEDVKAEWERDYLAYREALGERLRGIRELERYLMWLEGEDYVCRVYLDEGWVKENGDWIRTLMDGLMDVRVVSGEDIKELLGSEDLDLGEVSVLVEDEVTGERVDGAVFRGNKRT